jgi:hypothetical protein
MTTGIVWDNRVARNAKVSREVGRLRMCCPEIWNQGLKRLKIDDTRTTKIISLGCIAGKTTDLRQSHRVSSLMIRTIHQ